MRSTFFIMWALQTRFLYCFFFCFFLPFKCSGFNERIGQRNKFSLLRTDFTRLCCYQWATPLLPKSQVVLRHQRLSFSLPLSQPQLASCSSLHFLLSSQAAVKAEAVPRATVGSSHGNGLSPPSATLVSHIERKTSLGFQ